MFRPFWCLLILIYWVLIIPHQINVGSGFLLGVVIDLLEGSTLGIHALSFSIIAYVVAFKNNAFKTLALWQQALIVSLLSILEKIIVFSSEFLVVNLTFQPEMLLSSVINGILWPWIFLLLSKILHRYNLY